MVSDATLPKVTVWPTKYTVTVMPDDEIAGIHFDLAVEYRGDGRWSVCWLSSCLSRDGEWDYEPQPSSRTDEWLDAHRFSKEEAIRRAKEVAPHVIVNGVKAADKTKAQ